MDPTVILSLIIKNWYLFVVALILAFLAGRFYIKHTMPVYRTTDYPSRSTKLRKDHLVDNSELLQGLGLTRWKWRNLENQYTET
ncbi:MAG: hypothetical protein U5L72_06695 [Bacteroidales bacterium]|nr:hypothetical protein [Bacteroidales bacterium]